MSENSRQSPRAATEPEGVEPSISDGDVRLLRWSLIGFGLLGFIAPIALASRTGAATLDFLALVIAVTGATLNRRSFVAFPWTALLSLPYLLIFVAGCFSSDASDYRYWLTPSRESGAPHVLYLLLAAWGSANACLIYRFHRIQRLAGDGRPWHYSLRLLFGLTALMAIALSVHHWYYRLAQPPRWATVDALEQRYATQLSLLAEHAFHYDQLSSPGPQGDEIQRLFVADEIAGASVWTQLANGREAPLMIKTGGTPSGTSLWVRHPRIGHPIVNLWNGRFVEYQALLNDKKGVERGYSLIVDLSKMREGEEQ